MARFLVRRLAFGALVMLIVSIAVFVMGYVVGDPGPSFCGRTCNPDRLAIVERRLGLDRPILEQYWDFLRNAVQFDFGESFENGVEVADTIKSGLPATASLAGGAAVLWLLMGIPIGITAATKPRSVRDRLATLFALTGLSLPSFVVGLALLNVFYYQLTIRGHEWFPASGYVGITDDPFQWARHLVLPWFTLALITAASYARLTRGSMLEVLGEDYIRTARAKGLSERKVVYKHGVRSAMTPIVTLLGIDVGVLLGGTVVTENVFGLQGIGQSALTAVETNDLPVVLGTVLVAAFFIVIANILVDLVYALLDSRVRLA